MNNAVLIEQLSSSQSIGGQGVQFSWNDEMKSISIRNYVLTSTNTRPVLDKDGIITRREIPTIINARDNPEKTIVSLLTTC
jgi:hypothetical protein